MQSAVNREEAQVEKKEARLADEEFLHAVSGLNQVFAFRPSIEVKVR